MKQLKQLTVEVRPYVASKLAILCLAIWAVLFTCQTTSLGEYSDNDQLAALRVALLNSKAVKVDGHWYAKNRVLIRFKEAASAKPLSGNARIELSQLAKNIGLPDGVTIENGGYSKLKARAAGKAADLTALDLESYQVVHLNGSIGLEECLAGC